jgi:hypothetical protein
VIEQLYNRLEIGAFRRLPGGFEPAKRLGENKIRISNYSPDDYPVQMQWMEELFDVIVAGYNASEHTSLGNITPLQYLQMNAGDQRLDYESSDTERCSEELNSVIVPMTIRGNKDRGHLPHVNYMYVQYRNPDLSWSMVGTKVLAKVHRDDLRSLVLYRSPTEPIGRVTAAHPWRETRHDETTRTMIFQWADQGLLELAGASCAVDAYARALRGLAAGSQKAVDQLARLQQQGADLARDTATHRQTQTSPRPYSQWFSFDQLKEGK